MQTVSNLIISDAETSLLRILLSGFWFNLFLYPSQGYLSLGYSEDDHNPAKEFKSSVNWKSTVPSPYLSFQVQLRYLSNLEKHFSNLPSTNNPSSAKIYDPVNGSLFK